MGLAALIPYAIQALPGVLNAVVGLTSKTTNYEQKYGIKDYKPIVAPTFKSSYQSIQPQINQVANRVFAGATNPLAAILTLPGITQSYIDDAQNQSRSQTEAENATAQAAYTVADANKKNLLAQKAYNFGLRQKDDESKANKMAMIFGGLNQAFQGAATAYSQVQKEKLMQQILEMYRSGGSSNSSTGPATGQNPGTSPLFSLPPLINTGFGS